MQEKQRRFVQMLARLLTEAKTARMGDAWRSSDPLKCPSCGVEHTYQELLFKNGRSKKLYSPHADRLAVDLIIDDDAEARRLGEFWESLGGRWGGRFGVLPADYKTKLGWDSRHFELHGQI